jgi:hypothetical protein
MSANLDVDLLSCYACVNAEEDEREFFERMQDTVYDNIMHLEVLLEEHACNDEFHCGHCGEIHLQILQQQQTLEDNINYHNALTFLCDLHRNNVYGLAPVVEEEPGLPFVCQGCMDACPVHCKWD